MTLRLPKLLFPHSVQVENYVGNSAYGPRYAATAAVRCLKVDDVRLIRNPQTGEQTVSSGQLYCPSGTVVPAQSRVTLPDGTKRTAMHVASYDGGTLPLPGSVVIYLQ